MGRAASGGGRSNDQVGVDSLSADRDQTARRFIYSLPKDRGHLALVEGGTPAILGSSGASENVDGKQVACVVYLGVLNMASP